jgi:DNA-binding CsgD family transcriptional regulator
LYIQHPVKRTSAGISFTPRQIAAGASANQAEPPATPSTSRFRTDVGLYSPDVEATLLRSARAPAETLLEREHEMRALESILESARSGAGTTLLIEGAAGVGKTRLLAAARDSAAGLTVLCARGDELEHEFPFGVARQLFEPVLADMRPAQRSHALAGAAGLAAAALGLVGAGRTELEEPPDEAPDRLERVLHGLYWLTANLTTRAPLALFVDDLQWADDPSLRWLGFLARRLEGLRLAVALATRPPDGERGGDLVQRLLAEPSAVVLRPSALSIPAVGALLERKLDTPVDIAFSEASRDATGGVPFLVEQLATEMKGVGLAPNDANAGRVRELTPRSLGRALELRLARLPGPAVAFGRAAAVLGPHADLRRIGLLAEIDEHLAAATLDALVAAGVLAPSAVTIEFAHPLLRNALDGELRPGQRARLHLAAARLLDADGESCEAIAVHLLAAPGTGERWALERLRTAAAEAAAQGAPQTAALLLRRALRESPDAELRPALLRELGASEIRAGEPGALQHLGEGAASVRNPPEHAEAALELGLALVARGELSQAIDVLNEARTRANSADRETALRLEAELLATARLSGAAVDRLIPDLASYGEPEGRTRSQRLLLGVLAFERLVVGRPAHEVADLADRALAHGEPMAEHTAHSPPINLAAYAAAAADRLALARRVCDEMVTRGQESGSVLGFAIGCCWRSHYALRMGEVLEAEADARACVQAEEAHGWTLGSPAALAYLLDALVERSELDEAERMLADANAARQPDDGLLATVLLFSRGYLRLAQDRWREAADDLLACGSLHAQWGMRNPAVTPWRSNAAFALNRTGDTDSAERLADEELELATEFGSERALGIALRARALVGSGDSSHRVEMLLEARSALETSPARLEYARVLVDLGAAQRRTGERRVAVQSLREGLDIADRCGAVALSERARGELLSAGLRPRRAQLAGREALTGGELRVAELAGAGQSNRAIAQTLFISVKTVETHLRHVYYKLGVRSRKELAGALGDPATG